jgi:hypothetical protein
MDQPDRAVGREDEEVADAGGQPPLKAEGASSWAAFE